MRIRHLAIMFVAALLASSLAAGTAKAAGAPGGSWLHSCFADFSMKGSVLTANCGAINGSFVSSFINVNKCNQPVAIGNQDGHLICESGNSTGGGGGAGLPPGSWQGSCKNAFVKHHMLQAQCTDVGGVDRLTQIDLNQCQGSISNLDGALTCDH